MDVGPVTLHTFLWLSVSAIAVAGSLPWFIESAGNRRNRLALSFIVVCVGTFLAILPFRNSFAVMHVVYGVITCAVPAIGIAIGAFVLRHRRQKGKRWLGVLTATLLIPAGVGFYATNIEPNELQTNSREVSIKSLSAGQIIKVGVLADIQSPSVRKLERKAVKAVSDQQPDIILYAGDLYSGEDDPLPRYRSDFVSLVKGLKALDGVFFVHGDHDNEPALGPLVKEGGAALLDNDVAITEVRGTRVGVLGLANDSSPRLLTAIKDFAARGDLDVKIILAHHPDVIALTPPGIDLVVSGHTHGGQVQLPVVGPLMTLSNIPRKQAGGGLFSYPNGAQLFVTRGVGVEYGAAPKIRFGSVPEVNLLGLQS